MISSKKELKFFMMADSMMNRGYFEKTFRNWLLGILYPDYIMKYLRCMRCYEYYKNVGGGGIG